MEQIFAARERGIRRGAFYRGVANRASVTRRPLKGRLVLVGPPSFDIPLGPAAVLFFSTTVRRRLALSDAEDRDPPPGQRGARAKLAKEASGKFGGSTRSGSRSGRAGFLPLHRGKPPSLTTQTNKEQLNDNNICNKQITTNYNVKLGMDITLLILILIAV